MTFLSQVTTLLFSSQLYYLGHDFFILVQQDDLQPAFFARGTASRKVFYVNPLRSKRAKILIPRQLSVVGIDDIEAASFLNPALTTIRQPRFQMGQLAMQMTLNLIKNQGVQDKVLPVEIVVRQTTSAMPS